MATITPTRPVEEPPAVPPKAEPAAREISAAEHVRRILAYIRYQDFPDSCLFLAPTKVENHAARLDAFARNAEALQAFRTDFQLVNGFAAAIQLFEISEPQCEAVEFLHRLDVRADQEVAVHAARPALRPGEAVDLRISGGGARQVTLLAIDADGTIRNLSRQLRQDGNGMAARFDERESGRGKVRLLLTLLSDKPSAAAEAMGAQAAGPQAAKFLEQFAEEQRRHNADVIAVPLLLRVP